MGVGMRPPRILGPTAVSECRDEYEYFPASVPPPRHVLEFGPLLRFPATRRSFEQKRPIVQS